MYAPTNLISASNAPTETKKKMNVDPNAPKRANSAFILFSQAERANIAATNPGVPNTDIFKLLGEKWKVVDAETKAKYTAMYTTNKVKADEEIRAYAGTKGLAESTLPEQPSSSNKKPKFDPKAPKRAHSAFILFSNAERANIKRENPQNVVISKQIAEKWKTADAATKALYTAQYTENKAKADKEMLAYALSSSSPVVA
jgi:hypothetical protein